MPTPCTTRCRGLTLIELLIASAATALIGAAVVSMSFAVNYGTDDSRSLRVLASKTRVVNNRLAASVRGSRMILARDADTLIFWTQDLDDSDTPNLPELHRIDLDGAADQLISYRSAAGAPNTEYSLADDFHTITDNAIVSGDLEPSAWATNVTGWTITLDDADPQLALLMAFELTFRAGQLSETITNTAKLRN